MNRLMKCSLYAFILFLLVLILPSKSPPATAASILYVARGGYDGYDCLTPPTACGTIDGALYRAASGDTIEVTAETYYGYGEEVVYINKDISLSGDGTRHSATALVALPSMGRAPARELKLCPRQMLTSSTSSSKMD